MFLYFLLGNSTIKQDMDGFETAWENFWKTGILKYTLWAVLFIMVILYIRYIRKYGLKEAILNLIRIICFIPRLIIEFVSFNKTQYKIKSGNGFFKTRFNKGNWGEYKLYKKIMYIFGEKRLLTNIYLPSTNIDNTEIDVLGVYNGIIYCFEVKNYGGYIYGNKNDNYWTQVLNFRTKNKFYNPYKQNYAHQKALEEYLGIDAREIIPILVFSNRANLENVNTDGDEIFMLNDYFVFDFETTFRGTLSDEEIINKLSERTNVNEFIKSEHIKQIEEIRRY